eukprot:TRINITY_DN42367_c0_g1_i1.p1 TRINITY_DN42367_c0_g1~~TRINITY_DN42367_c0_g1_i1.p1  ORF type:complete len:1157 (-),score=110.91 TRINITY_DN42367_c0_g1_i1:49-3231(-)
MASLWSFLRPCYAFLARSKRVHMALVNHIGTVHQPFPRSIGVLVCLDTIQICASAWTVVSFICDTYVQRAWPLLRCLDAAVAAFLAFHYAILAIKNEFRLFFLFDIGMLIDVLTVPSMICRIGLPATCSGDRDWLSLKFLRSVQIALAYERLQLLQSGKEDKNEIVQQILKLGFRCGALVISAASLVLIFEVLGEPAVIKKARIKTAMGDIDFFSMTYWLIETISTVGYGDFAPKTRLSRFTTAWCMVSGIALFTVQLGKVMEAMERGMKGEGAYVVKACDHVVVMGGGVQRMDEPFLKCFFDELYHPSCRGAWPDMVMLCCGIKTMTRARTCLTRFLDGPVRQHVTLLQGSPLDVKDLRRCRCDVAKLIFVISNAGEDMNPWNEDLENTLYALSLKNTYPSTPLMLMLLMPDSKERAVSVGLPEQHCFSLVDLKQKLFWHTCRCTGLNTLLSNLMISAELEATPAELAQTPWLGSYLHGLRHLVHAFLPAPEFHGKPFGFLVESAYTRVGVCVIAAQVDGLIVLAPFGLLKEVSAQNVVFALAQDELMLHELRIKGAPWKDVFRRNQSRQSCPADQSESFGVGSQTSEQSSDDSSVRDGIGDESVHGVASHAFSSYSDMDAQHSDRDREELLFDAGTMCREESTADKTDGWKLGLASVEKLHILAQRAKLIRQSSMSSPFILLTEFTGSWTGVEAFLAHSRAEYLPYRQSVVVLCPSPPSKSLERKLALSKDDRVAFVCGSALSASFLEIAGVRECRMIACLGQRVASDSLTDKQSRTDASERTTTNIDSDTVMLHRLLDRIGVKQKTMTVEFRSTQNMRLLPCLPDAQRDDYALHGVRSRASALASSPASQKVDAGTKGSSRAPSCARVVLDTLRRLFSNTSNRRARTELETSMLDIRFASGFAFTPQVLGSLLGNVFRTPGIFELMHTFVAPDPANHQCYIPWCVSGRPEYEELTYGEVFQELIQDSTHPAIPLGLYRKFDKKSVSRGANTGFVWTNPPKDTKLHSLDMLFVLADRSFGQLAFAQGLFPMAPAGLTNLMMSKAARGWSNARSRVTST